MTHLTVTDVFYSGHESGLTRRVDVRRELGQPILVVAPFVQLAFYRRRPIAQDIAAYRKRRAEIAAGNVLGYGRTIP